jgi:hypothetical protein
MDDEQRELIRELGRAPSSYTVGEEPPHGARGRIPSAEDLTLTDLSEIILWLRKTAKGAEFHNRRPFAKWLRELADEIRKEARP